MLKEGMFLQGRYEIVGKIGTGGMADVYKAKDHKLNRFVAVKVLKAEFREDKDFITKFRAEAQAAARLAHPNIVNIYDVGDEKGMHFIVMELVEGITLKEYITKKGRLAVREATSIAIQVSQGLEAAHNSGIIHRDVKPQNVIISTDGKVKVTDFGIARATSTNTINTTVMGSVHYSSPEQARGGYSDAKGDIYSLGISFYEMLTGHVPFDGESTVAIAIKHLQEEMKSPKVYVPDLPKSTIAIINKCTQKSPDRRYTNMSELIRDLKESLVNPEGDFVRIATAPAGSRTVVISKDELGAIKEGYNANRTQELNGSGASPVNSYNGIPVYNSNNPYVNQGVQQGGENSYNPYTNGIDSRAAYGKYGYQEEAFDPDRAVQEEDEEDKGMLSPKLEKLMTVGSVIMAVLIAVIFLGLIANALGIFRFSVGGGTLQNLITKTTEKNREEETSGTDAAVQETQTQDQNNSEAEAVNEEDNGIIIESEDIYVQDVTEAPSDTEDTLGVTVPEVEGLDYLSAVDRLMNAGYYVSRQDEASDSIPEGTVISQSAYGEVEPGSTVILIVSTGAEKTGLWSCNAQLVAPDNYNGELVRLVLEHGNSTVTLLDGSSVNFPYDLSYEDAEAVSTGTVYLYFYNEVTGTYDLAATYDNVPFEES